MTLINVWANIGDTVTLEGGATIDEFGAEVTLNFEIRGLIAAHELLTEDPTTLSPDPSPLAPPTVAPSNGPYVTFEPSVALTDDLVLTAGSNVTLTPGAGTLTVAATIPASAPTDAEYLVAALSGGLSAERLLVAGANITLTPAAGSLVVAAAGGGGGGVTSIGTAVALSAFEGTTDGEIAVLRGYYADNDGGGGEFYWDAGSSATADDGLVFGAGSGRWVRLHDNGLRNVKWFGAKGDGSNDDTTGIQTALSSATNYGCVVYFPPGTYRITATLHFGASDTPAVEGITLLGCNGLGPQNTSTSLVWDGPAYDGSNAKTTTMIWADGAYNLIKHISFRTQGATKLLYAGVVWGTRDAGMSGGSPIVFTSSNTLQGCSFYFNYKAQYGAGIGLLNFQSSNLENHKILDCSFDRCSDNAQFTMSGGQPYNTVFERSHFIHFVFPTSIGIEVDCISSAQINVTSCDFNGLEVGVQVWDRSKVTLCGCQFESCKKVLFIPTGAVDGTNPAVVTDCRLNPAQANAASNGPNHEEGYHGTPTASGGGFIAADGAMIEIRDSRPILLEGNYMALTGSIDAYVEFHPCSRVVSNANTWKTDEPFRPLNYFFGYQRPAGGVWSNGDKFMQDVTAESITTNASQLPGINGGFASWQDVTISDTDTFETVTIHEGYDDAVQWGVEAELRSFTAGAAIGAWYVTEKGDHGAPAATQTTTFKLNVTVAPGAGKSVTYRVRSFR